jgi:hypothetical protein
MVALRTEREERVVERMLREDEVVRWIIRGH